MIKGYYIELSTMQVETSDFNFSLIFDLLYYFSNFRQCIYTRFQRVTDHLMYIA